jgi:glycosyl-4,4'-diaponeurosporenoate acyltransferase
MRVFYPPLVWMFVLDFFAWFAIHIAASIGALALPDRLFDADRGIYRTRAWEREGRIWQTIFRVKAWKGKLPDGAQILRRGFAKKTLQAAGPAQLAQFVLESRRAELAHLLAILPAPLFFLWNPPLAGWLMILYALAANGPCLIAQRYNRPRFQKLLKQKSMDARKAGQAGPAARGI